jgi:hypothetical protein
VRECGAGGGGVGAGRQCRPASGGSTSPGGGRASGGEHGDSTTTLVKRHASSTACALSYNTACAGCITNTIGTLKTTLGNLNEHIRYP